MSSFLRKKILPVILSGGSGTRLWPLSRAAYPKQYLNFEENNNYTLLQNTLLRLEGIKNLENPIVVCNEEQRFIVAEQLRAINTAPLSILLEPFGRNTAPAIALAALFSLKEKEDQILLVLSSDHKIKDNINFKKSIEEGVLYAEQGHLVTFGIIPTSPETGYGYIESEKKISNFNKSSKIKRFIEKPNQETANKFLKDDQYTWNSGIFLFKATKIIDELKKYQPRIIDLCRKAIEESSKDLYFQRVKNDFFMKCPNISIDNAVMEKTKSGVVIPLDAGWNDLGSWKAVWEDSTNDDNKNNIKGKTYLKNVNNSYVRSESRLVVGLGLKDMLIVETEDALLVATKDSINSFKELIGELEKENFKEVKLNKKVNRPWGQFKSVIEGDTWQVKRLEINPNESLSLQMHLHRSEHWVVVKGQAKIEINGEISFLNENESVYIPKGIKHRLSNQTENELILIEVQSGNYLGEDDIIRFEDKYRRKTDED